MGGDGFHVVDIQIVVRFEQHLASEQRALDFFTSIVKTAKDPAVRQMAEEFVEEEAEHVNLVHRLLRKYPTPKATWAEDPDPPHPQD